MRYCKNCDVIIHHNQNNVCPLCQSVLQREEEMDGQKKQNIMQVCTAGYPPAQAAKKKYATLLRICTFVGVIAMILLAAINYTMYDKKPVMWSVISNAGIVYLIFTLRYSVFNGDESIIMKIATQSVIVMAFCVLIDYVLGFVGWSFDYAIPCTIFVVDALIMLLMIIDMKNWQNYILLQIMMVVISVILVLLTIPNIVKSVLLPLIAAGVSIVFFLATWIFGGKQADVEIKRRFHI